MTPTTASSPGSRRPSLLQQIEIASPCTASWDDMTGSDRVRFCGQCAKNVYDISAMTTEEAEKLVTGAEGRLCVRLFKRFDGTVLTQDCPRGLERIRRRMKWAAGLVSSFLAAAVGGVFWANRPVPVRHVMGEAPAMGVMIREPDPVMKMGDIAPPQKLMGKIAMPPPVKGQKQNAR